MESELFGHKKGAFTHAVADRPGLLAEADGGTLFLDEVTTLPLELQARLLRVLQEREYRPVGDNRVYSFDVQLISASSTRLRDAVTEEQFRADLQYRLEVIPLDLPPLRERGDDAVLLFEHFLSELAPGPRWTLSASTAQQLRNYSFSWQCSSALQHCAVYSRYGARASCRPGRPACPPDGRASGAGCDY